MLKYLVPVLVLLSAIARADGFPPTANQPVGPGLQSTSGGVFLTKGAYYGFSLKAVNLAATGDAGSFPIPFTVTKFMVTAFNVTNCSATPVLAQVGLYTAASAGGTNLVAQATITGATSASVVLNQTALAISATATSVFANASVANALALTCDLYLTIKDLS